MIVYHLVPQADRLDRVCVVVDAVASGADSANQIGDTIGVHARQGSYYANAAMTLGYVENRDGVWLLTSDGEELADTSAEQRAQDLALRVSSIDWDQFSYAELDDTTTTRRALTQTSWLRVVSDLDALTGSIARAMGETTERTPIVLAEYREARAAKERELAAQRAARQPCRGKYGKGPKHRIGSIPECPKCEAYRDAAESERLVA